MPVSPDLVLRCLESNFWAFARSMGDKPHWYTLKENWQSDTPFSEVVKFIRENGTSRRFYRATFTYWKGGDYEYWSMGAPLDETRLINRAYIGPSNDISVSYECLNLSKMSILDLGEGLESLKQVDIKRIQKKPSNPEVVYDVLFDDRSDQSRIIPDKNSFSRFIKATIFKMVDFSACLPLRDFLI